jgi:hypothetical protein
MGQEVGSPVEANWRRPRVDDIASRSGPTGTQRVGVERLAVDGARGVSGAGQIPRIAADQMEGRRAGTGPSVRQRGRPVLRGQGERERRVPVMVALRPNSAGCDPQNSRDLSDLYRRFCVYLPGMPGSRIVSSCPQRQRLVQSCTDRFWSSFMSQRGRLRSQVH